MKSENAFHQELLKVQLYAALSLFLIPALCMKALQYDSSGFGDSLTVTRREKSLIGSATTSCAVRPEALWTV